MPCVRHTCKHIPCCGSTPVSMSEENAAVHILLIGATMEVD